MARTIVGALILLAAWPGSGRAAEPLVFEKAIPLASVEGRIDHMAADIAGQRLFVAALGNKTLEVLDWNSGKRMKSIGGLDEPQGIVYRPDTNRLYVATGGDGSVQIFDGASFALLQTIKLGDDADNVRLDAAAELVWVGYGSGALAAIDSEGKRIADIPVTAHPESFQLEKNGSRIFVNVPRSRRIEVIDREKKAVAAKWSIGLEISNFPMALDEKSRRLFIVCRTPARLIVFDTDSGKIVAKVPTVGDSDDLFFDAARRRIYATGGEGAIVIYEQQDADRYNQVARIATAAGARTSLFIPEADRLFIAVPHRGAQPAEIRVYRAEHIEPGLKGVFSTPLLHQRGSALTDFLKRYLEATKLLRAQFREHYPHLPGMLSERRNNEVLAARCEGDDPNAAVFGALDPADQAFLDEAVHGDTDRTWSQIDDRAYRIDGQWPLV